MKNVNHISVESKEIPFEEIKNKTEVDNAERIASNGRPTERMDIDKTQDLSLRTSPFSEAVFLSRLVSP